MKYKLSKRSRLILILMSVAALFALGFTYFAAVSGAMRLVVDAPEALRPGDEFEVTVTLENNPGVILFCLWLTYDETRFEFVSAENGPVLHAQSLQTKDVNYDGARAVRVTNGLQVESFDGDGVLYIVKFRVKESAASGPASFALTYREGDIVGEPKQPGNAPNNFAPSTVDATVSV